MITLEIGKGISSICDAKNQTERFVGKWQIDNFGALFCWKQRLSESGNWILFFFKGKITLKNSKAFNYFWKKLDRRYSEYTSAVWIIWNRAKFEDTKEHFIFEGLLNICRLHIFIFSNSTKTAFSAFIWHFQSISHVYPTNPL